MSITVFSKSDPDDQVKVDVLYVDGVPVRARRGKPPVSVKAHEIEVYPLGLWYVLKGMAKALVLSNLRIGIIRSDKSKGK